MPSIGYEGVPRLMILLAILLTISAPTLCFQINNISPRRTSQTSHSNANGKGLSPPNDFPSSLFSSQPDAILYEKLENVLEVDVKDPSSMLPIFDILKEVRKSLQSKPNLLLEAPPGAGKTTIVPLALLNQASKWKDDGPNTLCNMVVVEPRRVAARSAALRMANLLNTKIGDIIGYSIRGESRTSVATKITVITDGVLLNKIRQDPELNSIDAVLFDEFHERGVASDTALALCRESQKFLRPDLRILVMSATLLGDVEDDDVSTHSDSTADADANDNADNGGGKELTAASKLVRVMGGDERQSLCHVLRSDGRQFDVQMLWANQLEWKTVRYQPLGVVMRDRKLLAEIMCHAIEQGVTRAPSKGDVLAFLPGVAEIRRVIRLLEERGNLKGDIDILPLFGALPKEKQDAAIFLPTLDAPRRVIVSSPIAEASLTLERVTCVVDSGLKREPRCDIDTGMPRLVTRRCSKASAVQRAGRAGRVQEGLCLRIYNEVEFEDQFLEHAPPEISSTDLSPTLLLLADWGCKSVHEVINDIPFVDPPDKDALEKAVQLLIDLEALEKNGGNNVLVKITSHGREVAKIPTNPRFATTILRAKSDAVQLAAAVAVAYLLDDEMGVRGSDGPNLATRVRNLYGGKSGASSVKGLVRYAARIGDWAKQSVQDVFEGRNPIQEVTKSVGLTLLPGFIDLVAERKGDASYGGSTYMLSLGRSARLDDIRDASEYLVVVETSTGDDGKARIRSFASIEKDELLERAVEREIVFTVPSRGHEVRARRVMAVGSLELASTPLPAPSPEKITSVLKDTIRGLGGVYVALVQSLSPATRQHVDELCSRVRLATQLSETDNKLVQWPACFAALDAQVNGSAATDDEGNILLEELIDPWLAAAGSLKKIHLYEILLGSLTPDQQRQLDADYPVKIDAPDGSKIPVRYASATIDDPPTASAKLQQFFGNVESPAVGPPENRLPLSLSLLSPGGKVLAQTIDLPFFWKETYPLVRAEMRGRYTKHPWPEDPLTAIASRDTSKQQAAKNSENATGENSNKPSARPKKKQRGKKR